MRNVVGLAQKIAKNAENATDSRRAAAHSGAQRCLAWCLHEDGAQQDAPRHNTEAMVRKGFFSSVLALASISVLTVCSAPAMAFQPVGSYLAMKQEPSLTIKPVAFPTLAPMTRQTDRATVEMPGGYEPGTILVVNSERKLYLSVGYGRAIAYPIAIGKPGMSWTGTTSVVGKAKNPTWTPTPNTRRMNPDLPAFVAAGPKNPLGPRALYLASGYYRIHGTNKPSSIGSAASLGCFRMHNSDVVDLYSRVEAGTKVVVIN